MVLKLKIESVELHVWRLLITLILARFHVHHTLLPHVLMLLLVLVLLLLHVLMLQA